MEGDDDVVGPPLEYELMDLGRELLPAVDAIIQVGLRLKKLEADGRAVPAAAAPRVPYQQGG